MNSTTRLLCLLLVLAVTPLAAQNVASKFYIAKVVKDTNNLPKRDRDEIAFQARTTIANLESLLTSITDSSNGESEVTQIMQNSYNISQNQLFYNDAIIVEDDINPAHRSATNTADLPVDRYLNDLNLFYGKSSTKTIAFSKQITSSVMRSTGNGNGYFYVKVFFTSTFRGKRIDSDSLYQPVDRVAELRADKSSGKWRTYITRLAFPQPGEGLTEVAKPILIPLADKKPIKLKANTTLFRRSDGLADSLTVKWNSRHLIIDQSSTYSIPAGTYLRSSVASTDQEHVTIELTNYDQHLIFTRVDNQQLPFDKVGPSKAVVSKKNGSSALPSPMIPVVDATKRAARMRTRAWIEILMGTAALGASYAGYSQLKGTYNTYTAKLTVLNAEYAVWQTLTQQPGAAPATPVSFNAYAQPGIYGVYGGATLGGGLLIDGIRLLIRAHKVKASSNPTSSTR
ncbi:hypothetical protein GCM10027578_30570 [Spirosoma luteolum]